MTLRASALQWGVWNWLSADPDDLGMKISAAFDAFSKLVNAKPDQPNPLSIVRNHASSTSSQHYGFVWRLGDAHHPVLLRLCNRNPQAFWAQDRAELELAYETDFVNDSSNHGYGTFTRAIQTAAVGLSYYGPALSSGESHPGFLLVQWDSSDGREFFCCTFGVRGSGPLGADYGFGNQSLLLFHSPHSSNWNVLHYSSPVYGGPGFQQILYLGINDTYVISTLAPDPPRGRVQQLCRGFSALAARQNSGSFSFRSVQERILLPSCFWFGANAHDSPRRFGRLLSPAGGGTFYQLGAGENSGSTQDLWYLHPTGTPAALAGWSSVGSLPWQTISDRLSFCPLAPLQPLLIGGSAAADFITDWPAALVGNASLQQHPFFSRSLASGDGSGGGGTGGEDDGGGSGGAGGGSGRPATGVLWPRRS
jgi:uncharacterized membrane protein YgcG